MLININRMSMKIKELEQMLSARQIKPTAMRLLVLEYLIGQASAVSLKETEDTFEKADRITLYRTLKNFEEKGMVTYNRRWQRGNKVCFVRRRMHLCSKRFACTLSLQQLPKNLLPAQSGRSSFSASFQV